MVFVGDLVDRGPNIPEVLKLVMGAIAGSALLCRRKKYIKQIGRMEGGSNQKTPGAPQSWGRNGQEGGGFPRVGAEFFA